MEDISITSAELKGKNLQTLQIKAEELSKYTFWHYSGLQKADMILHNRCFHVSNIGEMNDLDEIDLHKLDKEFVHCLCFCNSNTEKIPMWYLYAGITGKGVAIGLTPATMILFLKSIDKIYTIDDKVELTKGKDFDIEFGWIYYQKKDQPSQVMYKRKWYSLSDDHKIFETKNYFIKSYPWEYEKEFRIIIFNKTKTPYKKIKIKLDDIYSKLKLKLAPELSTDAFSKLLPSLPGFSNYFSTILLHSNLRINMDLCKHNIDDFIDFLENDLKKESADQEIKEEKIDRICRNIKKAKKCRTNGTDGDIEK